jgi:hypothetical protein
MLELQNYIESGGGYRQGVLILEKLNPLCSELIELRKYVDKSFAPSAAQELLRKSLLAFYQKSTPSVSQPIIEVLPTEKEIPPIILKLKEEQRLLRDERRAIHFNLEDTAEQSDRAAKALQIRSLSKRIDTIFQQLDEWELRGNIPKIATVGDARAGGLEVLELTKKAKYLTERISRLKNWANDKTLPLSKRERYTTEISLKKSELSEIEMSLKTLKET